MAKVLLLIVEDEISTAEMYAEKFKLAGYQVDIAHDGQEGFDKMVSEHPSLVLMDIVMPGLSGEQAVEKAKHDPATKNIPIIMLTNYSDSIELKNALSQGAAGFVVKSETTPSEVVERVKKLIGTASTPAPGGNHKYLTS
ncbi:response regulator [Candidatus Saccharibacteria bacterium]|nr:response regulator [Candidatus Saccharibacteria bacterium]